MTIFIWHCLKCKEVINIKDIEKYHQCPLCGFTVFKVKIYGDFYKPKETHKKGTQGAY